MLDDEGSLLEEISFNAWGNRRDPNTWLQYVSIPEFSFDRGYTGHEHLDLFSLINMNGRVYDPVVCRFLSPDAFVQAPENLQNFNRYSYALNNPLKYTDPSGEFIVGAIMAGMFINTAFQLINSNINSIGDFYLSLGVGGLAGVAGAGVGGTVAGSMLVSGFGGGAISGAAGGFAGGFIGGTGNAWIGGLSSSEGIGEGFKAGGWGALLGGSSTGILNGFRNLKYGGDFWGFKTIDFLTVEGSSDWVAAKKLAKLYNGSQDQKWDTQLLKDLTYDKWAIKEGNLNITKITTHTGRYGLDAYDGYFVTAKGELAAGYVIQNNFAIGGQEVHISPWAIGNPVSFEATVGHELIHASHHYLIKNYNVNYSEAVAYRYSSEVLFRNGYYNTATNNFFRGNIFARYDLVPDIYKYNPFFHP